MLHLKKSGFGKGVEMKTAYRLLMEAPDSVLFRAQCAYRAAAKGEYSDAASYLAHAATEEGDTTWAREAGELAAHFRGANFRAIELLAYDLEGRN